MTTSVMLLGLDFSDIDVVGMVRPLNMCQYVVQAAGRGGRNMGNGQRKKVLFYLPCNSDISTNVPGDKKVPQDLSKGVLRIFYAGVEFS